jgi:hypothetical protein
VLFKLYITNYGVYSFDCLKCRTPKGVCSFFLVLEILNLRNYFVDDPLRSVVFAQDIEAFDDSFAAGKYGVVEACEENVFETAEVLEVYCLVSGLGADDERQVQHTQADSPLIVVGQRLDGAPQRRAKQVSTDDLEKRVQRLDNLDLDFGYFRGQDVDRNGKQLGLSQLFAELAGQVRHDLCQG